MAGIAGNDDSFVAFAFAIVSIVMIFLYFPVFIGILRDLYKFVTGASSAKTRRRRDEEEEEPKKSWRILYDDFVELPSAIILSLRHPTQLIAGARLLWSNKGLAYSVFFWDGLRFCFRPRFFTLWLWAFLLSSAMYASMTFDPYGVLGLPTSASTADVKRAYRALSKLNHPDVNKTDAAKQIYPLVRKAYKALVDRDAFDKDAETEDLSVGIALPAFLTSHEHDGKILFSLLAILIGVPFFVWYKFRGGSTDKLRQILSRIHTTEKQLEPIYLQLGIPLDPKFVERRRERRELTEILVSVGLLPVADDGLVDNFPPLTEFKKMCLTPEKNTIPLAKLGLDVSTHQTLKTFFESYELEEPFKLPEGAFARADSVTYEVAVYIIRKAQQSVEKDLVELSNLLQILTNRPPELRAFVRLQRHHDELLETLALVYRDDVKPQLRDVKVLIEVPQKREELVREVPKEINGYFMQLQRDQNQHMMMMQQMMKKGRR